MYFPDAVASCVERLARDNWENLRAECYKTSDRQLLGEVVTQQQFDSNQETLFGRVSWKEGAEFRYILLREMEAANLKCYDLVEPAFTFEFHDAEMQARTSPNLFTSVFHRWAGFCKKLYYLCEPQSPYRLLLQRMTVAKRPASDDSVTTETVRLDFITQDQFMKFSIRQRDHLVGEVVTTVRKMD